MSLRLNSMIEYQALVARMKGKDAPPAATAIPEEAPRKSKFNAVITEALGIKFHSKRKPGITSNWYAGRRQAR